VAAVDVTADGDVVLPAIVVLVELEAPVGELGELLQAESTSEARARAVAGGPGERPAEEHERMLPHAIAGIPRVTHGCGRDSPHGANR